jgi:holo-[acyl-carrier protein] synthase
MSASPVGIGVDLVKVARVARAYERFGPRLIDRVFTPAEAAYCLARADAAAALAGRFAAKEAVFKALSPATPSVAAFREIAVGADGSRPCVTLSGEMAAFAGRRGVTEILVSISHEREYAVAFAAAYGK